MSSGGIDAGCCEPKNPVAYGFIVTPTTDITTSLDP